MNTFLLAAALAFTPADAHLAYETAKSLVDNCTPRDAGTIRGRIAANHILDAASSTGADVRRDVFRAMTPKGEKEFTNLYAEFRNGRPDSRWVVVLSHFDTKPGSGSPGANDGVFDGGFSRPPVAPYSFRRLVVPLFFRTGETVHGSGLA